MASWREVVEFSQALVDRPNDGALLATPMRLATVIRLDGSGRREAIQMRWGFSDRSASSPASPKHMHVRCETIDERPTFRAAFAKSRGILMVRTFNEGEEVPVHYDDGSPTGRTWTRQWTISSKNGQPIAFAVICEDWIKDDQRVATFVLVTTPANRLIGKITDRMPAVLRPGDWGAWLGETPASPDQIKALLRSYEDDGAWEMAVENPEKKPPRPRKPKNKQMDLL